MQQHNDPSQSSGSSSEQISGMEPNTSNVSVQLSSGQQSGGATAQAPRAGRAHKQFDPETFKKAEAEWRRKHPRAVPIQRNIDVLVRRDQLAVISAEGPKHGHFQTGKSIPLTGDTVLAMEELAEAVREEVANWGIAGADLYWRPALVLRVTPGGEQRAADVQRLMSKSGIEVRVAEALSHPQQGGSRATR
jgi:hypothetical protein